MPCENCYRLQAEVERLRVALQRESWRLHLALERLEEVARVGAERLRNQADSLQAEVERLHVALQRESWRLHLALEGLEDNRHDEAIRRHAAGCRTCHEPENARFVDELRERLGAGFDLKPEP